MRAAFKSVCVSSCFREASSFLVSLVCTVETWVLVRVWVRRMASTRRGGGHLQLFSQRGDSRRCLNPSLLHQFYHACIRSRRSFERRTHGGGRFEIRLHTPGAREPLYRHSTTGPRRALDGHSTGTIQALYGHSTGYSMRATTATSSHRPRSHRDLLLLQLQSSDLSLRLVRARSRFAAQLRLGLQLRSALSELLLRR